MNISRNNLLTAIELSKSYDNRQILNHISLTLKEGELASILGKSGVGKTTLFNLLSGLDTPDTGNVFLKDLEITGKPGHISYMLQKDLLLPYKKMIDNVSLPLRLKGCSKKEARRQAAPFFEDFGLKNTELQYPDQLSGGMRQRAALLRTYLASGKVVLLDEPFSALDAFTKREMHKWYLTTHKRFPMSTLFITHDIEEALYLSDKIYILSGTPGMITAQFTISHKEARDEFLLSTECLSLKKEILKALEASNS